MDIEEIRDFCNSLPFVKEDIKWKNDLCFLIGNKMFCVCNLLDKEKVSFKVKAEEFEELTQKIGFIPAPYLARYHWILVEDCTKLKADELKYYISQSYELIKSKLAAKVLKTFV